MASYVKSINVNAPVHAVYHQWTRFEEFPRFMQFVREVRWLSNKRLRWHMQFGGIVKQYEAIIVEEIPDQLIRWRSVTRSKIAGSVAIQPLGVHAAYVTLSLDYTPDNFIDSLGESLGLISAALANDLSNFKHLLEAGVAGADGRSDGVIDLGVPSEESRAYRPFGSEW